MMLRPFFGLRIYGYTSIYVSEMPLPKVTPYILTGLVTAAAVSGRALNFATTAVYSNLYAPFIYGKSVSRAIC